MGCGNQIYLFSRFLHRETPAASPAASIEDVVLDPDEPEDIFQLIAHQNGPLFDFHPTVLAQCLLWGELLCMFAAKQNILTITDKLDLVRDILIDLVRRLKDADIGGNKRLQISRLEPSAFFSFQTKSQRQSKVVSRKYDSLFDVASDPIIEDLNTDDFTSAVVEDLIDRLDGPVHLPLSHLEKTLLATIAQATLEVERQRRSLDLCGLRYLISLRIFVNQNRRSGLSGTVTPASGAATPGGGRIHRTRLSFRNIVWATHSESQDVLLSAASETCNSGKMVWADAKRLGVFLWLKSTETVVSDQPIGLNASINGAEITT